MDEHLFEVIIEDDYTYRIKIGAYEKLQLLSTISKCCALQDKMGAWLDSDTTAKQDKEKYMPIYQNLLRSISFMWHLLNAAGCTNKEIEESIAPF